MNNAKEIGIFLADTPSIHNKKATQYNWIAFLITINCLDFLFFSLQQINTSVDKAGKIIPL